MADAGIDMEGLLELLRDLIRIESVNPSLDPSGSGEAEIAGYLADRLGRSGLDVRTRDLGGGRMNVVATLKGSGSGRSLMLSGHMDTVSLEGMESDPLGAEYRGGRVYGRGSLDMKAGIAAMALAVEAARASGPFAGDVILALVADEEYASIGTEALVKECSADAAVLCEPTGLAICTAHKGFCWVALDVFGKAAHGSRAAEGVDAITKAGKFLARLEDYAGRTLSRKAHPRLGPPSVHASTIKGGLGLSTYPDRCTVQIERRIIPGETPDTVRQEFDRLIRDLRAEDEHFRAEADVYFSRPPLETSEDEPIVRALDRACAEVLGAAPAHIANSAWLDTALLAEAGIPAVSFGPSGEGLHGAVEYVDLESAAAAARVLVRVISDFCG